MLVEVGAVLAFELDQTVRQSDPVPQHLLILDRAQTGPLDFGQLRQRRQLRLQVDERLHRLERQVLVSVVDKHNRVHLSMSFPVNQACTPDPP